MQLFGFVRVYADFFTLKYGFFYVGPQLLIVQHRAVAVQLFYDLKYCKKINGCKRVIAIKKIEAPSVLYAVIGESNAYIM